MAEVWLRNLPLTTDPLRHLLLCTLTQAEEEIATATNGLTDEQLWQRPHNLTPLGFHIRHIAESIDRLLTYAEGQPLNEFQLQTLKQELTETLALLSLIVILEQRLNEARHRIESLNEANFSDLRHIGRARIPVPLATLLAHIAEHTQRHLGQLTTTAKLLKAN
jgi:uncharacterized damage-inducible protein DinB